MEVELSLDLVNSCNITRKRQATMESCTIQSKKRQRACREDSSRHTENTSNLETENRLFSCTQSKLHDYINQPLDLSASSSHMMDINGNIVNQINNDQEMEISYDSAITRSLAGHVQKYSIPTLLVQDRSSSVCCSRCLTGEPGHINHLSS
ncbi:hypothetical protein OS493_021335 [Desmophyllum pertusum]|uniref:Uncharacterized protein n=1 Tax=Desmophyllum pertusum TaxID=174260 RepID=A0A9X0CZ26_9CNID|nr:hypothetical protein OS493_021335 [Desmophyllum pertusum]